MQNRLLTLAVLFSTAQALDNGVGKLPKMGYDTFNAFGCDYDQDIVLQQAEAMVQLGLVDAGYNSIILDDCYTLKARSANGTLVADPDKWPYGLKNFTATINAMNISASAYSDNGYQTCAGYPGAYGHEVQDLLTWQEWGFDYLKYDNCYIPFDNVTQQNMFGRYQRMADAIVQVAASTGQPPFQFSLCEWGWQQVFVWGSRISHSWRINGDIKPWWSSITSIIDQASFSWWASDFYGHNDMDIMEVGNTGTGTPVGNLTYDETKAHFTAWALLKSPLIIGTDLSNASSQTVEILTNKDLIRINQDPNVGQAISPFRWGLNPDYTSDSDHPAQFWSGNSTYGVVVMLLNTLDTTQDMFFNLTESWALRAGRQYTVYDMWSHADVGIAVRNWTATVPAHGVAALLLNDDGPEPDVSFPHCGFYYQCSFPNGTYSSN
ncbi:alpha-galactosidase [Xylariales sp. AK1849]|nr:alpha-galactosidase [Xylariales sp. AK1849]